jgi:hypothetical protein
MSISAFVGVTGGTAQNGGRDRDGCCRPDRARRGRHDRHREQFDRGLLRHQLVNR